VACTLLGVSTKLRAGPVDGCAKRKTKKASVVQNQPILTKKTLNRLRFFAKYEGAKAAGWDCVVGLYGADRAEGLRREKSEPMTRVAG